MFNLSRSNIVKSPSIPKRTRMLRKAGIGLRESPKITQVKCSKLSTLESASITGISAMFSTASQSCNIAALGLLIFQKMASKCDKGFTQQLDIIHSS